MRNVKWLLLLALAALLLPWLGETLFNTKGEPREAIVAVSMLESGNWVLPVSCGGDIPYKPPFLAWLIAIFSWIFNGGVVNEFLSRLPSALAAIALVMGGYGWAARHGKSQGAALAMAIVTITSFEVYRAAVNCRVDMLLTACMCLALYQMYEWRLRPGLWRYLWISLLLSGAVLTKGPVGSLLPCLAMGLYCLLRGDNFFKSVAWLAGVCLLSMALPALWYWKAYQQGGGEFLRLALEENIGRLTGTMSYESHVNPWHYNLKTIAAGMLPWTLLALAGGVWAAARARRLGLKAVKERLAPKGWWRSMPEASAFAIVAALTVLVFYTIPQSKRSVYLLPMYPFMAYGMALLICKLREQWPVRAYSCFIFGLALLLPFGGVALQWLHPAGLPIEPMPWWRYPLLFLPIVPAAYGLMAHNGKAREGWMLVASMTVYLAYASAIQPMVLNAKSDLAAVGEVEEARQQHGPVYGYISYDGLLRYYTLNFYLNDNVGNIREPDGTPRMPAEEKFCVLASPDDCAQLLTAWPGVSCRAYTILPRSCDTRRPVMLIKVTKKD